MSRDTEPAAPPSTARIVLLTTDGTLETWQRSALDRLLAGPADLVLRIAVTGDDHHPPTARWLWNTYERTWRSRTGRACQRTALSGASGRELVSEVDGTDPTHLPDATVARIREVGCDIIVNFSGRRLRGLPPHVSRHGLWEHRMLTCAGTVGRTLRSSHPTPLELRLVRVTEGGTDEVLQQGWVNTVPRSLSATMDAAHWAGSEWLAKTYGQIRAARGPAPIRVDSEGEPIPECGPALARYLSSGLWRKLRWATRQLIWQEEWHLGVVDRPIEDIFASGEVGDPHWFPNPSRRHFLADPFALDDDTVLAEQYDYLTRRGAVAAVHLGAHGTRPGTTTVLRGDGHLSYPYLFRDGPEIYCIPESCDQQRSTLYRAASYPTRWEKVCDIVEGLAATDPTVFQHDGRWWLLCTDDDLGPGSNLHLYMADEVTGPWRPHPDNPVKVDIRSSRPAGRPFLDDGVLVRPAQSNDRGYGSGVVFNVIDELSPRAFAERTVGRLTPPPTGPYRHGLHTVTAWGGRTLVDGKRKGPSLINLLGRALQLAR